MLIPIIIDTADLAQKFSLTKEQVESVCDNIAKGLAASYARNLQDEANIALHQTKQRYVKNIRVIDSGRLTGTVMLDYSKDKLIKMLEEGASPFDIKQGLMNSSKVKVGKNGKRYITVPFRWGTPGAVGDADVFSGVMPTEVYNAVRSMSQTIPVRGGGSRTPGLNTSTLSNPFLAAPLQRRAISDSAGKVLFNEYKHKTSLYSGITQQKDGATGQNRYFSFRRVSTNSDSDAFVHPGIEQYHLVQKALSSFDQTKELSKALDIEWSKLGF